MNYLATTLSLVLCSALVAGGVQAAEKSCAQTGANAPLALHKHWIMEGWEKRKNDAEFVFAKKMARYYDLNNPAGIFWDNFAPGKTQLFDNASVYGAYWEGLQANAESVRHALTEGHSELIGDKVASTTLGFVGTLTPKSGDVIAFDARSQLGWQCIAGEWKIRQELNYAWVVKPEDIASYYQAMEEGK